MVRDDVFIHLLLGPRGGQARLRLVASTRYNCFPVVVLELLQALATLIQEYCGGCTEAAVRANHVLVHELIGGPMLRPNTQPPKRTRTCTRTPTQNTQHTQHRHCNHALVAHPPRIPSLLHRSAAIAEAGR
jgi:hypothetical protein